MSNEELSCAIRAALAGGAVLIKYSNRIQKIKYKGVINLVTEADHLSQKIIIGLLKKDFPDYGIISEENFSENITSTNKWIIDPLDGTTNYAHNFPIYSVAIGLEVDKRIRLGVVYHPILKELFYGVEGHGSYLNNCRIFVSKTKTLNKSLLATGFPYDKHTSAQDNIANFARVAKRVQGIRRGGAAALDFAYVAAGRLDGFWELKLSSWDTAAGVLLVAEAGGAVSRIDGSPFHPGEGDVVATNGVIHDDLRALLRVEG